jgi:hypothetical protein
MANTTAGKAIGTMYRYDGRDLDKKVLELLNEDGIDAYDVVSRVNARDEISIYAFIPKNSKTLYRKNDHNTENTKNIPETLRHKLKRKPDNKIRFTHEAMNALKPYICGEINTGRYHEEDSIYIELDIFGCIAADVEIEPEAGRYHIDIGGVDIKKNSYSFTATVTTINVESKQKESSKTKFIDRIERRSQYR